MNEAQAAGAWVKSQRLAVGMTQEELAGKSGLSVRAISNLERGRTARPHPRSLELLAVALGLPETDGTAWAARLRAPSRWTPPAVMLGTWTSAEGDGGFSTVAGQHPNVANIYLFWGNSFPTAFAGRAQSAGATPFVEIEPWQGVTDGDSGECAYAPHFPAMTTIGANGPAIRGYLAAFGKAIASFGHPVIITFARGFNVSGQYPWAQGDCEGTTPAQWIQAWDTVRSDVEATAGGLAHFMWAPGADTGGTTIDPTPYWPGASQVDLVGVEGYPNTRWGSQLGTFSGLFGPVFNEIHALTDKRIFIAETDLARLDGDGYESLAGFISDLCSNGGDGVLQFQTTQTLSDRQWKELDNALADDCGAGTGSTPAVADPLHIHSS